MITINFHPIFIECKINPIISVDFFIFIPNLPPNNNLSKIPIILSLIKSIYTPKNYLPKKIIKIEPNPILSNKNPITNLNPHLNLTYIPKIKYNLKYIVFILIEWLLSNNGINIKLLMLSTLLKYLLIFMDCLK